MQYIKPLFAGLLAISLIGCAEKKESEAAQGAAADQQAIQNTNAQWLRLIKDGNAVAVSELYTPDGAIMPPGAPKAQGPKAIEKVWSGLMATQGFGLTFKADDITVSSAGDMALDRGTYRLETGSLTAPTQDVGKYVVVWRKIEGKWKVAADIFNSDGATAQTGT